jgi:hypothetical protein
VLRIEIRPSRRAVHLADGTPIRRGDRVGILHLDNHRIAAIHDAHGSHLAVGLEFRRLLVESLETLATAARPGGRLADLVAVSAVTIFHRGLGRLGFEAEHDGLVWPRVTAGYQRALLASFHPDGVRRRDRVAFAPAARLWLSRDGLLTRYGSGRRQRDIGAVSAPR